MRRFELTDGSSSKFWEVSVSGKTLSVHFGRIGTNGQLQTKILASAAAAKEQADRLVAEKLRKGYAEVGAPADPSPLETGVVESLLLTFESLTKRTTSVAVWRGSFQFPKGGVEKWRKRKIKWAEETVGERIDRFARELAAGKRFLDLGIEGDKLQLRGWDWLDTWEHMEVDVAGMLEAAAGIATKGKVTVRGRFRHGDGKWTSWKVAGKRVDVDEGDGFQEEEAQAAMREMQPSLDRWLHAHPTTRLRIERTGQFGYVDGSGRSKIEPRFGRADDFSEGLAVVQLGGWETHLIDVEGNVVGAAYQSADRFMRGLAPVAIGDSDHWGYVDRAGEVRIPPKFADAQPFHGKLAMVRLKHRGMGRWLTSDGELVGDPFGWYPQAADKTRFSEGCAWCWAHIDEIAEKPGAWCVDEEGRQTLARKFHDVQAFSEGLAAVIELGATQWQYIDAEGNVVIATKFDEAFPFKEGRALVRIGKEHRLIDAKGRFVGGPFASNGWCGKWLSEGMLPFSAKGKLGFLGRDGEIAIAARFEQAVGFFDARAMVAVTTKKGGSVWGYVDRKGEYVVRPVYESAHPFREGLAAVQRDGLWGFIDPQGGVIVEPQYAKVQGAFSCGLAWVQLP